MKEQFFKSLTNQYSLSKTLRFSLIPQGDTLKHIQEKGLLAQDENRDREYQRLKEILNLYHEEFITEVLNGVTLAAELLKKIETHYWELKQLPKNDAKYKSTSKLYADYQIKLRKEINKAFRSHEKWKDLFKDKLIKEHLTVWVEQNGNFTDRDLELIEHFKSWTTYFSGYNENRKNVYSSDEISTAIPYRIVHVNLPKFLDNKHKWEQLQTHNLDFSKIPDELKDQLTFDVNYYTGELARQPLPLDHIFALNNFNNYLTQRGIEQFNQIVGGVSGKAGEERKQGINEIINLSHQQANKKQNGEGNKRENLRRFKMVELHKQILCTPETASFRLTAIENDQQLVDGIKELTDQLFHKNNDQSQTVLEGISELLKLLQSEDIDKEKIYLKNNPKFLTQLSQQLYGNYSLLEHALEKKTETLFPNTAKNGKVTKTLQKKREDYVKNTPMFSVHELEDALEQYTGGMDEGDIKSPITHYFTNLKQSRKANHTLLQALDQRYAKVQSILNAEYEEESQKLKDSETETQAIKSYLDGINAIFYFIKPFEIASSAEDDKGKKQSIVYEKDEAFYTSFTPLYDKLRPIVDLYNKARNYITQKPFSEEKYKLNFENVSLAKGWDKNKETDNTAVLLTKGENQYYLAVMEKKHNKSFANIPVSKSADRFQKVNYKLLPGASKMLPKVFFSDSPNAKITPSEEILRIRNTASHTKGGTPQKGFEKAEFNLTDCRTIIDFYKASLQKHEDWKHFGFRFSPTDSYENISEFYREIEHQGYKISFRDIDSAYIDQLVAEGKLYLFKIHNKDFSARSTGRKNLHTLYWEQLFSPDNLKDVIYKLDGEAELFYRKKSIEAKATHPKGIRITNKYFRPKEEGEQPWEKQHAIDAEIVLLLNLHHKGQGEWKDLNNLKKRLTEIIHKGYEKDEITFDPIFKGISEEQTDKLITAYMKNSTERAYDLIKDKRYTQDQFSFHVSLTQNFKADKSGNINQQVNQIVADKPVNILSIDRGERHLAYYTLIDTHGKILRQESLNVLNDVDYHSILDKLERERTKARQNWKSVTKIKNAKAGYLSAVVNKLTRIATDNNAVIVLEDLNFGFKRGRYKIEKQIYQNLEKALIDKSSFLVFKDKHPDEFRGLKNAGQLCAPFESFQKMGKQMGYMYYLPAHHTSKICPATGFVNLLYPKYHNLDKSKEWFDLFNSIRYNPEGYFEFEADYTKFNAKAYSGKPKWTICTYGDRLTNKRNAHGKWETKEIDLTKEIKVLLDGKGIRYQNGEDVKGEIVAQNDAKFFKDLTYLLKLTLQLRNSQTGTDQDFILSPIKDIKGNFFDSRKVKLDVQLPQDADANGAFHIGIKFLIIKKRLEQYDPEGKKTLDLKITNEEWYTFAQEHAVQRMKALYQKHGELYTDNMAE